MAKKGRSCELCDADARMFCESDQARLCWDCDEKVHAANFLVAKHVRTALCHVCHKSTPWKASGPMLGRTVSVCSFCVTRSARAGGGSVGTAGVVAVEEEKGDEAVPLSGSVRIAGDGGGNYARREEIGDDDHEEEDSESSDEDFSDSGGDEFDSCDDDDDDDDDDDENQVVPWTSTPPPPPPASATSTSSSEEEDSSSFGGGESVSTSRFRGLPFSFHSTSEIGVKGSSSSSMAARSGVMAEEDEEILRGGFVRPWKRRRVGMQP